jgi:hypothetical protein
MNRREFGFNTIGFLTVLFLAGCQGASVTQPQLQALLAVIGKALGKIDPLLRKWNPKIASDIEAAYKALDDFAQKYKPGDDLKDVEALVNALVNNLQAIVPYLPPIGPLQPVDYIGLIQLIVATVEGILALLPIPAINPANISVSVKKEGKSIVVRVSSPTGLRTFTNPPQTGPLFALWWNSEAPQEMQI